MRNSRGGLNTKMITYHIKFFQITWESCDYVFERLIYKIFLFLYFPNNTPHIFQSDSLLCIPFLRDFHQAETENTESNGSACLWKSPNTLERLYSMSKRAK